MIAMQRPNDWSVYLDIREHRVTRKKICCFTLTNEYAGKFKTKEDAQKVLKNKEMMAGLRKHFTTFKIQKYFVVVTKTYNLVCERKPKRVK
jgi:hypothetical protein